MKLCDICGVNLEKESCKGWGVDLCWFHNKPENHTNDCMVISFVFKRTQSN